MTIIIKKKDIRSTDKVVIEKPEQGEFVF